jgi:DNA damage-binding protein 1
VPLISRHLASSRYDGLFKVIPATASGSLVQESFNIRLEELHVVDMVFLHNLPKPTLALLYQDNKEARHVKTYEVMMREKDFGDGPWPQTNVEAGASMLIALKGGGVIIVGEVSITYFSGSDFKTIATPATCFHAFEAIDPSRYLLADSGGGLHVLVLQFGPNDGSVVGLALERMGTTSLPTTVSYLTEGLAFIGSTFGDSQLVQLSTEPNELNEYITELERWQNIGPIVDFVVVDLERHGQGSLVTCSGAGKDGSLRIVRNGIGINEQARIELPGIKGLWTAHAGGSSYLVLSFISETRVLAKEGDELGEVEVEGFDGECATVCCAATSGGGIVQVTTRGARLVDGTSTRLLDEWLPPAGASISMATIEKNLVLLATAGSQLHLLEVRTGRWNTLASVTMEHEVACLAICSAHMAPHAGAADAMQTDDDITPTSEVSMPPLAACGLWTDLSIRLLSLPSLVELHSEPLGGVVIPRSLAFASFSRGATAGVSGGAAPGSVTGERIQLLCALGDGQLVTYSLVEADAAMGGTSDVGGSSGGFSLGDRKTVTIGTKPIQLTPFRSHGQLHVFAASDRPTVLHSATGKLLYSNINLQDATHMAPFACDADAPDTLAIASDDALILGTIDEVRKLHIRSVYLHEQPRRIAHIEHVHAFALLTMAHEDQPADGGDERECNFVRLLDEITFERTASFELMPTEAACSILTLCVPPDPAKAAGATNPPTLLVVGTAFSRPDEPEPTSGRLLVFDVSDRTLELVCEHSVKGAVYSLEAFGAHGLLAGINNKLQLYEWSPSAAGSTPALRLRAEHCGHILVLYIAVRGDFVLVGDLMKSLSLYQCSASGGITELARDYSSHWMTSVAFLDDDTYIGTENSLNLFVARKNADATTDDDRNRLEVVGEFHLGEFVNRIRRGSLAMQVAEAEATPLPTLLYGTVNGVLGLVASLPQEDFQFWSKVQTQLTKVIKGVGGMTHAAWRAFRNDRKDVDATNVIDGDLIEAYLNLAPADMAKVCEGLSNVTVDELTKRVEDLARLH